MSRRTRAAAAPKPAIVDYADISRLTGQSVNHLRALYSRGVMPRRAHLSQPVWYLSDILHWIEIDPRATPSRPRRVQPEK